MNKEIEMTSIEPPENAMMKRRRKSPMITIRYGSIIIDGVDKTGKVESLPNGEAQRLIQQGYAEVNVFNIERRRPPEIGEKISAKQNTPLLDGSPKKKPKRKG